MGNTKTEKNVMTDAETTYLRALQPEIVKRMGELIPGDWFLTLDGFRTLTTYGNVEFANRYKHLRIPLAIDPENPERGLWGMVDWGKVTISYINDNGNIAIDGITNGCDTPYLALLKALAAQWGVTERGI